MSAARSIMDFASSTEASPVKKRKLASLPVNLDDYAPGALIKMKLVNFVTYSLTEFNFTPSLNMIIGPNGSGKSTVVCAICLGLAGKTENIGRSKHVKEFVKNGTDQAKIEITIKDRDSSTIVITRYIYLNNKSDYKIDGRTVTETEVRRLVDSFNIQLDNLCQFLSQERVEKFATLEPHLLLVQTMRAIDVSLLETFKELQKLDDSRDAKDQKLQRMKQRKAELDEQKEKNEAEARRLEEVESLKEQKELHKSLLPFATIQDHKAKQKELRERRDTLKEQIDEFQQRLEPFTRERETFADQVDLLNSKIDLEKQEQSGLFLKVSKVQEKIAKYEEGMAQAKTKIKHLEERHIKKKKKIEELTRVLEDATREFNAMREPDSSEVDKLKDQMERLNSAHAKSRSSYNEKKEQLRELESAEVQAQRQLAELTRRIESKDRLGILYQKQGPKGIRNTAAAAKIIVEHIRHNREQYRGKVFEPPVLSLKVTNEHFTRHLETLVDNNTLLALVFPTKSEYDELSGELSALANANFRYNNTRALPSPEPREFLNRFGFDGYMIDYVDGPPAVIQMLCEQYAIHKLPVAKNELSDDVFNMLKREGVKRFISGDTIYNTTWSDYTNEAMTRAALVKSSPYWLSSDGMSKEQRQRIQRDINELKMNLETINPQKSEIERELADLERNREAIDSQRREVHDKNRAFTRMQGEYKKKEAYIGSLKEKLDDEMATANVDVTVPINKTRESIWEMALKKSQYTDSLLKLLDTLISQEEKLVGFEFQLLDSENKRLAMKNILSEMNASIESIQNEYESVKRNIAEAKQSEAYKKAQNIARNYTAEAREKLSDLVVKYQEEGRFSEMEINRIINSMTAEIESSSYNSASIDILHKLRQDLESFDTAIPELEGEVNEITKNITLLDSEFRPKLEVIVSQISEKFASLISNVGSAGAVELEKPTRYNDWKLKIMVQFRDTGHLQQLDSHTQSGGERAVSTVSYMIALQGFAQSPFRVVDEINQGMDARNERIIHKLMVENACQENTSQYFLVTPKLLTDLHYHPKMMVHCVVAGIFIPNPQGDTEALHLGRLSNYV